MWDFSRYLIFFFCLCISNCFQHHLLKGYSSAVELFFYLCQKSVGLVRVGLFICFLCGPFICYFPSLMSQSWLLYALKSGRLTPLTILFQNSLPILISLLSHINFRIILSISTKKFAGILIRIVLNLFWGKLISFLCWIVQYMSMVCLSI